MPRQGQRSTGIYAADCENCGHFFKYRAVPPYKTNVSFTVNGVAYTGMSDLFDIYGLKQNLNFSHFENKTLIYQKFTLYNVITITPTEAALRKHAYSNT